MSTVGGTFVDRHDRRTLIIVNAVTGMVIWGTVAAALAANLLTLSALLCLSITASAINGLLGTATDAMLREIINVRDYPQARSINEGRDAAVNIADGPLGGALYGVHPWLPFAVTAVLYAIAGASATRINTESTRSDANNHTAQRSFAHDLAEGWRWTWRRRTIIVIVCGASVLNFGVNGIQYSLELHMVSRHCSATLIGVVNASVCVGMFVGACIANRVSAHAHVGKSVCAALALVCASAIPLACTDSYAVIIVSNTLLGAAFPLINALLMGFVFAKTPKSMQGRVTVAMTVPSQTLSAFCSAAAGGLLSSTGYQLTMCLFVGTLIAAALCMCASHALRVIPSAEHWAETPLQ